MHGGYEDKWFSEKILSGLTRGSCKHYMINCINSLQLTELIQLLIWSLLNEAFSSTCAVNSLHFSLKTSYCMNYLSVKTRVPPPQ